MKHLLSVAVAAVLVGCAVRVPTTGVVNRGGGVYTVAHQAETGFHSSAPLRASATQEATEFCQREGKKILVLHAKETPGRANQYPEYEIVFKCE